jgi:hypothetical protein
MSVAVAHADPGASLAESQVRAGDPVHFTITNGDGHVSYEIEVAGRDVLRGSGEGPTVSGQFTTPNLGTGAKSVKVEIDIEDEDDKTEVARTLQYLGAALPPAPTTAPEPAAAAPLTQAAPAAPAASPAPAATPKAKQKAKQRAKSKRRKRARKIRVREQHRSTPGRKVQQKHSAPAKTHKRVRRPGARTAPLFDGVPERGASRYQAEEKDISAPKRKVPTPPVFATAAADTGSGEPAVAILVPGLLGLAGFLLAAATVVRRRRNQ